MTFFSGGCWEKDEIKKRFALIYSVPSLDYEEVTRVIADVRDMEFCHVWNKDAVEQTQRYELDEDGLIVALYVVLEAEAG